jgi:glycosyltransferase involved in cell wall biosynthesis
LLNTAPAECRPSHSNKEDAAVRIAQVSPLYESVPPKLYGGTERVVSYLTEELVRQGHEVTLFASGDSTTTARLIPITPEALRLCPRYIDPIVQHVRMVEQVAQKSHEFDVVHFHIDYIHFPVSRRGRYAHLTTLHGRLDIPDLGPLYWEYGDMPVASISNSQRAPVPWANWHATVYHGLPEDLYKFHPAPGQYLAFLGRISPEKRVDRAIEIAGRAGLPLKIAAKVDNADRDYFTSQIEPLLDQPHVEFIGEIGESQKNDFLGNAIALLFPIDWPEPFGLVMIESMACGTPVIAFRGGSVDEVMEPGRSGFVCKSVDEAVAAVEKVLDLSRDDCRRVFAERYTVARMARDYVEIFNRLFSSDSNHARSHYRQRAVLHSGSVSPA